jgi:hypothetical protein
MVTSTNGYRAIVRAQPAAWQAQASQALADQYLLAIILLGNAASVSCHGKVALAMLPR